MGKLIVVVGNSGVGKTTLTRALCAAGDFATGLEEHIARPFQALFKNDAGFALANQIDYLLLRAEQERLIRADARTGIQDGGLEMDFFVFTRLFQRKGLLSTQEYRLCERLVCPDPFGSTTARGHSVADRAPGGGDGAIYPARPAARNRHPG